MSGGEGGESGGEHSIHGEIGHFRVAFNLIAKLVRLSVTLLNLMCLHNETKQSTTLFDQLTD